MADCRRLCEREGWEVVDEYVDNDISAYSGKRRPRYEAMLEDIRAGRLDAVVAYHQDRLTRSPREFEDFLDICETAGVRGFSTVTGFTNLAEADGVMVARKGWLASEDILNTYPPAEVAQILRRRRSGITRTSPTGAAGPATVSPSVPLTRSREARKGRV